MGVSKTKKKIPARIRKTIRRTLSGVCIASAIIVALVPAEKTTAYVAPSGASYNYGVDASGNDDLDLSLGINLGLYNSSADYSDGGSKIYEVLDVQQKDASFEINWQYKLYTQNVNGTDRGVICDYNDTYPAGDLIISSSMPFEYFKLTKAQYDNFYGLYVAADTAGSDTIVYNGRSSAAFYKAKISVAATSAPPSSAPVKYYEGNQTVESADARTIINKYYSDALASFISDYDTALSTWNSNRADYAQYQIEQDKYDRGEISVAPTPVSNPGNFVYPETSYTFKVSGMSTANNDEYRRTYFCDIYRNFDPVNSLEGYILSPVDDATVSSSTPGVLEKAYLAKGVPNISNDPNSPNDEYGFYIKQKADVIAIGKRAFSDTTNVAGLTLSPLIKFIGDEAFVNSWVQAVTFTNVEKIGNRAFKNCDRLVNISLQDDNTIFGTECFAGTSIQDVTFKSGTQEVGYGAFANCPNLVRVDMSSVTKANSKIDAFAFYNDIRLNYLSLSQAITQIGDCAFACSMGVTGSLTEITLPENALTLGDYLFAGRGNLQTVNMPANLGRTMPEVELPLGMFYNCSSLACLNFPVDGVGSCGYVKLPSGIFSTVMNKDFYVKGPKSNGAGGVASPRKTTWGQEMGLLEDDGITYKKVPYVYTENGVDQYELSDGEYILIVDNNGVLQSCDLVDNTVSTVNMVIPAKVGSTPVTAISSGCFDRLKTKMTSLKIENDTISEIDAGAFKDFVNLGRVDIGNSVTKIGDSAFEGCNNLKFVSFETPKNGYSSFPLSNIGTNAFKTNGDSLIFEGDINVDYGPFSWAMQLDNYVDKDQGTRVCYKTGYPTYLTVILDNRNGLPTLVDHPHYEVLNTYSQTEHDEVTYKDEEGTSHTVPWKLTDRYEKLGDEFYDYTVSSNPTLYTYAVSLKEADMISAAINLDVPSGIKSIDAKGFITNTSKQGEGITGVTSNTVNVSKYLSPVIKNYAMDGTTLVTADTFDTYKQYGLFGGFFGSNTVNGNKADYPADSSDADKYEVMAQGNDRIESITLHTVEYLPDEAFYSCEKLRAVTLGDSMRDLGNAPFAGCTSLTGIGSTTPGVTCTNGIVYSENADGTKNIVEILSARGKDVGSKKIVPSQSDPELYNVSSITDGAFNNCPYITSVDFTGMSLLTEIPDECFKNCKYLNQVVLPENIKTIGHNAFAGCMEGIELVCYGKEVYLPPDAFGSSSVVGDNRLVESKRVVSYADSAVRKAAKDLGADVTDVLDDVVKVQFFDYDGTELSNLIFVKVNSSVALEDIPANPVREGYTFAGWNKDLRNVTQDMVVVATYTQSSSTNPSGNDPSGNNPNGNSGASGNNPSGNNSSASGNNPQFYTLTVTNGNGSGSYAAGATVIITCTEPPAGKVFDKWVPTTDDLGIASVNVAATTLKMPAHEASVAATFKNAPTNNNGSGSSSSVSGNTGNKDNKNGSTILISKPGVSNTSLASAQVSGSSDNYVIRIAETAAATAAVEKALTNEYGSLDNIRYSAMDITLYDATGTNRITDYSGLSITITMPIPDVMTQYAGNNKVAGVVNEKLDKLNPKFTSIDGVPCVTFTATHFSPYTIYVDTANLAGTDGTPVTIDGSPKTGDGIHPKWFLVAGLTALGIALFFMKDRKTVLVTKTV